MSGCAFPKCRRPLFATGLCAGHYQQQRRGDELRPLREPTERDQFTFRLPKALRDAARAQAKREGIDEPTWWRRAGANELKRGRR